MRTPLYIRILSLILLLLALNSCTNHAPVIPGSPLPASVGLELMHSWNSSIPDKHTLKQRIVLKLAGKQYDFNGIAAIEKPDRMRLLAVGELGGVFFDFLIDGEKSMILTKPASMPLAPLEKGVLEDIRLLYSDKTGICEAFELSGFTHLVLTDGKEKHIARFDKSGQLLDSHSYRGSRLTRRMEFIYSALPGLTPQSFPVRISLKNYRYHYEMEIETVSAEPTRSASTLFTPQ